MTVLACLDSDEMAAARRLELDIDQPYAADLGRSAVEMRRCGSYVNKAGEPIEFAELVGKALEARQSIPPEAALPDNSTPRPKEISIRLSNETTIGARKRLVEEGHRPHRS